MDKLDILQAVYSVLADAEDLKPGEYKFYTFGVLDFAARMIYEIEEGEHD